MDAKSNYRVRMFISAAETGIITWESMVIWSVLEPAPPSGQQRNCNKTDFLVGLNLEVGLLSCE